MDLPFKRSLTTGAKPSRLLQGEGQGGRSCLETDYPSEAKRTKGRRKSPAFVSFSRLKPDG
jgi:hypothetical protein